MTFLHLILGVSVNAAALVPLTDPTRPPGAKAIAEMTQEQQSEIELQEKSAEQVKDFPELRVNAIRLGDKSKFAIINGGQIKLGETVESATLTAIHSDYVVFDFAGEAVSVSLVPSIKSKAKKHHGGKK